MLHPGNAHQQLQSFLGNLHLKQDQSPFLILSGGLKGNPVTGEVNRRVLLKYRCAQYLIKRMFDATLHRDTKTPATIGGFFFHNLILTNNPVFYDGIVLTD
jgi:hypothetical protein